MADVRLQKVIAAAGLASRREAERMIRAGRVEVNGNVVTRMGIRVDPARDEVRVDGRDLPAQGRRIYLLLNKPRGVLTASSDERGRTTVMDLLGVLDSAFSPRGAKRVFHVGRLDYNSEGLLLLTNDGALAMNLSHPSSQVPRTYRVRVRGRPGPATLARLVTGIELQDGPAAAVDARLIKHNRKSVWVEICVVEGRNRLVRRMLDALDLQVQRLVRVEYGGVELGGLPSGAVRELTAAELAFLRRWRSQSRRPQESRRAVRADPAGLVEQA